MSVKQVIESKYFKVAAIVSGILLVALVSFAVGIKVGSSKALFSARFGENYERNFLGGSVDRDGRGGRMMERMWDKGMRNAHGTAGEILSVSDNTLIIKDRHNQENTVSVSDATVINRGRDTLSFGDLTIGQNIVVVGKPQDAGVIAAHLIRIFDVSAR